jgi:hypothetical protein
MDLSGNGRSLAHPAVSGIESLDMPDLQDTAVAASRFDEHVGFQHRGGDWLFDKQMDPPIQPPQTDWKVEEGWGSDYQAVDPAFHGFVAGKGGKLERLFDLLSRGSHRVGDSHHLELRQFGGQSRMDRPQMTGSCNP